MTKVLIVDDEPLILTIAQAQFEDAGYDVIATASGDAALSALENDVDVGLLFTDIRMPGNLDGWTLAEAAREILPALPVIYATGFSHDKPRPVVGSLFFMKPYRLAAIIEAAEKLSVSG